MREVRPRKDLSLSPFADTKAAAAHLGVHVETIRRWVRSGLIPSLKCGRQIRFRLDELDAYFVKTGGQAEVWPQELS
jgi:excisionase family DNA binding protein